MVHVDQVKRARRTGEIHFAALFLALADETSDLH